MAGQDRFPAQDAEILSNPLRRTEGEEATAILRERVLNGDLAPGERLHQVPLALSLGVSRTPLREALVNLAQEGLLEYEANRGYTVRRFGMEDIQQAYAVRARLEGFACWLCATQGLPEAAAARLRACLEAGDRILAAGTLTPEGLPPYRAMNVEFHETLLACAENRFVRSFVHQTQNVPMASDRLFVWEDHAIIRRSHDDHHRILRAILAGQGERAEALMREHVTFAWEVLRDLLRR
ncbi:GntR family transcriptional regulator, vanillate catabolism transcriptional regulator [Roseomonas rosea]|uniref:GntR family transcriptional regulator, vanillate catabolism transcriptional regulator n=2 Tax=Muricoccus roseus TaxID=198092 RepID=A0A1M6LS40_9PROT|nr:GntR family transcriptional regulator [Roseomonas rosea]SHJ74078.1 GntR family transcriptional regulator, vanillate catabolism transcriptional regulator [Roseomonas rosea]